MRERERASEEREIDTRGRNSGGSSAAHGGGGPVSLGSLVVFSVQFQVQEQFGAAMFRRPAATVVAVHSSSGGSTSRVSQTVCSVSGHTNPDQHQFRFTQFMSGRPLSAQDSARVKLKLKSAS
ncbi:hypothetical protein Hanom_Chr09g00867741 [Helianthus anomalus]